MTRTDKILSLMLRLEKHYLANAKRIHEGLINDQHEHYNAYCRDYDIKKKNIEGLLSGDAPEHLETAYKALSILHGKMTSNYFEKLDHHRNEIKMADKFLEEIRAIEGEDKG